MNTADVESEDVLKSWKENRFIIAGPDLLDNEYLVILTDIAYWSENADELRDWCEQTPGATSAGMTVIFDNQQTLTLFLLRWS
jgi:hypothetical protein